MLRELHFEDKYLRRGEKCTLQWSMNPVPTVYSQKLLSKPSPLPNSKLFAVFPEENPSQMNCQHSNKVI